MRHTFHRQNITLIISLLIMTSCNMTKDFTIVKRKYMKGYHVEIPSILETKNKNPNKCVRTQHQLEGQETDSETSCENLLASLNSESSYLQIIESFSSDKKYAPPDTTKPKKRIAKKLQKLEYKKIRADKNNLPDDRKLYMQALLAFFLICVSPFVSFILLWLISLMYSELPIAGLFILFLLSFCLPIIGIVLGFKSRAKIKKSQAKLKGLIYSNLAIILGFLYYASIITILIFNMIFLGGGD